MSDKKDEITQTGHQTVPDARLQDPARADQTVGVTGAAPCDGDKTRPADLAPRKDAVSQTTTLGLSADFEDPDLTSTPPIPAASPAFPETTALAMQDGSVAMPVARQTTELGIGTLINNNYEITQVIKAGGMGEVYRGVEIGTGDPVAIKAVLPELAEDEKAGLLFKREARTLRQLSDEAIVRYYNFVHDRDLDRYFLVMEFIEGVPLAEHTEKSGPLSVEAALHLMRRLATGLGKAHEQDVVHRDLSPDNVMLPDEDVTKARLIDFGIAKSNLVTEGTMHGQFAGKFKFVAPEQLGHFDGVISPATDVYGLALMISASVMGKPLDMGTSIVEAVESRRKIPDVSGVPEALRPIVMHMLEPDPAYRPASMDALIGMLENPGLIPERYRAGLPPPPAIQPTGRGALPTVPPITQPPPGLQVPLSPAPSAGATTVQPLTMPPMPASEADGRRGGSRWALIVFAVLASGAGIYGWQSGLLSPPSDTEAAAIDTQDSATPGIPEPRANTREGFLAAFDTGTCTYTTRIPAGRNAGMIEGFSDTGQAFPNLPAAYEAQFGARPAILPRTVLPEQCAALDFARALQGRGRGLPLLQMSSDLVQSGAAVSAELGALGDQAIWTVLVSPKGALYNLTERLSEPSGGTRDLSFGLTLTDGDVAVPQLVLVVTSDQPLTMAAAAADGEQVAERLPLVLEEIADRGGTATATLGYVLLTPADG